MSAQVVISQLPTGLPLTGIEVLPLVQNGITIQASTQAIADLSFGGAVVSRFNTRAGVVSLLATDVTDALGYTPGSVTAVSGTGTVSGLTLSGSVTTTGSLTLEGTLVITPADFGSQPGNTVLAAPNGATGTPTFRALLAADIPTLNQNTIGTSANVTGIVAVVNGGTGTSTPGLVAGTNISVTGAWPNQTINSTASSGTVTNIATGSGLSGGPITTTGTINLATAYGDTVNPYASKNLSFVLAAPSGSSGLPTFRALVASDIPTLNQNTTGTAANVSGVVAILNGGTNATTQQGAINSIAGSVTSGQYLRGNGTNVLMSAIQAADVPTLNQNTTGTAANVSGTVAVVNGGTGATTPAGARTNFGATTVGGNFFTLTNPSAISFVQINADNTLATLDAANFRAAIGAGTGSGSVTSVGGAGTVSGLTLTGTVTGTGNLTLGGTLAVTPSNFASQTANTVLAAPNGSAGVPTFRTIVAADIPTLNQNTTGTAANVTGIVAVANGGTGTATPGLVQGTNVTITGTWPNQTINATGGGTVTSVTGTSPVTSSGGATPAISLAASYGDTQNPYASKTANTFLAAPNGSAGVPTFRAVVAADIPTLNQNTTGTAANVTGIVAVANGGSGTSTPSLVGGTNVTVSGSWPNQTINSSGGGGGSSTITISNKTGAYTVVAGDLATVINCTSGTFTVSLTAAATLGAGFNVTIWNTGTGVITIDPNGAETLDGVSTIVLRQGEGAQVVCDGTNWQTGNKKVMRGYAENIVSTATRPTVSGDSSVAIGVNAQVTGTNSASFGQGARASANFTLALGLNPQANGERSIAIGNNGVIAGSSYSTALGHNSGFGGSTTATGSGAMALGGSYASGVDSFAAAIADNTSIYGATGANSVAMGFQAKATGPYAVSIGWANTAGNRSVAIGGQGSTATDNSVCIGTWQSVINEAFSSAIGGGKASDRSVQNRWAYGLLSAPALGAAQGGLHVLYVETTNATPTVLVTNSSAVGTNNQVILPNNSAYAFTGTVIARQQAAGGSNYAAWEIKGAILRGANAASTVIGTVNINALSATAGASAWVVALTADTTNGGLAITVTGAASTNIRWVATVQTSEVIYA